jgi:hypothetical protein
VARNRRKGLLLVSLAIILLEGTAYADVLSGSLEWFAQNGDSRTTDAAGLTTGVNSRTFLQRYYLNFNSQLAPLVNLRAGLRTEKQASNSESEGNSFKVTRTLLMPSAALTLGNPFVSAGVGYDERDEMVETGGVTTRTFRDTKNAYLGFKPEGLPTLDLRYVGTAWYDRDHKTQDRDENMFMLSSMYRPLRSLQLNYSAIYDELQDHITRGDTKSLVQSARVGYTDRFFNDRWLLAGNYNVARQDVEYTRGGLGDVVRVQLFPTAGLSSISDTPQLEALSTNPALIDGNLTAGSGINIGQLPSQTGDTRRRNIGLDFGIQTTVSTLYVWVDRPLPSVVANSFLWEIYTSPDNLNWFLAETVFPANFGQFDNRFEISFPAVSARYVKVATRPLSIAVIPPPGYDVSNIFITEVQSFRDQSIVLEPGSTSNTVVRSNAVDLNSRLNIIRSDRHSLLYDLYYRQTQFSTTGQPASSSSMLTNSLIANERFSKVFSGSAKVMLENDEYSNKSKETYTDAEASLMAAGNSLRKLGHTLVLTAKRETWELVDTTKDTGTASLINTAEVYPGINGYLGVIKNLVSSETGTALNRNDETQITFGTDIIPNRSLTINVSYVWSGSEQTGNVFGAANRRAQNTFASAAYNPFSSLYLYGSVQKVEETGRPTMTSTSFNGSWATAVTGGALEFRLLYSQNTESETGSQTRTYGPYVRYRMNIRASLEATYLISMIENRSDRTDSRTFNTTFKMFF